MMVAFRTGKVLRRRGERGAALVEFAIVSILLFTLLLGIIDFSIMMKNYLSLSQAAREGARSAALGSPTSVVQTRVQTWATNLGLKSAKLTLPSDWLQYAPAGSNTWTNVGNNATGNNAPAGSQIRVKINYSYDLSTGSFLATMAGVSNPVTLGGNMVMRRE